MENYWNCNETKTAEIIDSKFDTISQSLESIMDQRTDQLDQSQRMDKMRIAEIAQMKSDIYQIQV